MRLYIEGCPSAPLCLTFSHFQCKLQTFCESLFVGSAPLRVRVPSGLFGSIAVSFCVLDCSDCVLRVLLYPELLRARFLRFEVDSVRFSCIDWNYDVRGLFPPKEIT